MYIDSVVMSGLVIVLLTGSVLVYALWFFYQHVRQDEAMRKKSGVESEADERE